MQGATFLSLPGVPGGAVDARHAGEIEVLSWSWGASNPVVDGGGGGAGAGKVTVQGLKVRKRIDKVGGCWVLGRARPLAGGA